MEDIMEESIQFMKKPTTVCRNDKEESNSYEFEKHNESGFFTIQVFFFFFTIVTSTS